MPSVFVQLPIEAETSDPYALTGRWMATIIIIERALDLIVEMYLIRSISFDAEPQRLFWRQHVGSFLSFDRKVQMIETIVKELGGSGAAYMDLAKRLRKVREMREHLAHRLLANELDGFTVITDAWGKERRRFSAAELERAKDETLEAYNLCAQLGGTLNRRYDVGP